MICHYEIYLDISIEFIILVMSKNLVRSFFNKMLLLLESKFQRKFIKIFMLLEI